MLVKFRSPTIHTECSNQASMQIELTICVPSPFPSLVCALWICAESASTDLSNHSTIHNAMPLAIILAPRYVHFNLVSMSGTMLHDDDVDHRQVPLSIWPHQIKQIIILRWKLETVLKCRKLFPDNCWRSRVQSNWTAIGTTGSSQCFTSTGTVNWSPCASCTDGKRQMNL